MAFPTLPFNVRPLILVPPNLPMLEIAPATHMIRRISFIGDRVTQFTFHAAKFDPIVPYFSLNNMGVSPWRPVNGIIDYSQNS